MLVPELHENDVLAVVEDLSRRVLDVYRADPGHVQEHANNERRITQGGYGERQLYELVQNGADENFDCRPPGESKIHVVLTESRLYCANTGEPMTPDGADTILRMAVSRKRSGKIGRFGVGVKSVLSVSDTPRFYSRTGSFGFDKEWSSRRIRETVPGLPYTDPTPVLRMAQPLELEDACLRDTLLGTLMQWASTTVVLPLKPGTQERLGEDLRDFPAHFMLFSPHVDRLVLEDARSGSPYSRELAQQISGRRSELIVTSDGKPHGQEVWKVFRVDHPPSPQAADAAGELHGRSSVPISWAVPDKGNPARGKRGNFWAYFPTNYSTTLTGILNAPWRTPEDRQNLTRSIFNEELMERAAELVVDSIPELMEQEDPGSYLALLTARGREAPQWGDDMLSARVLAVAAGRPSLPDQDGMLRLPAHLLLHPQDLDPSWLKEWAEHPGRPRNWCHHSVESRERRSRAREILDRAETSVATLSAWLEALTEDRSIEGAKAALKIAAAIVDKGTAAQATEARRARILLTERGNLRSAAEGAVYRGQGGSRLPSEPTLYLHPLIAEDPDLLKALQLLNIQEANPVGRLTAAAIAGFTRYRSGDWEDFWKLARVVETGEAAEVLKSNLGDPSGELRVRTAAGIFRPVRETLLAGPVVPAREERDRSVLIDPVFHAGDVQLLRALGAIDRPLAALAAQGSKSFDDYRQVQYNRYLAALPPHATRPRQSSVALAGALPPGPLELLRELSPEGRAAFARELPENGDSSEWCCYRTNGAHLRLWVESPLVWMLSEYGTLTTSMGLLDPKDCVSPELDIKGEFLPRADIPVQYARALKLPAHLKDVPQKLWRELIKRTERTQDAAFAGAAYTFVLRSAPAGILDSAAYRFRCNDAGQTALAVDIAVTHEPDQYKVLLHERVPALLVPTEDDAQYLVDRHRFRSPSDLLVEEIHGVPLETPVPLTDLFPRLRQVLPRGSAWKLVHCSSLVRIVRNPEGRREEPLSEALDGYTVLLADEQDEEPTLRTVDRLLGLRLGEAGCRALLEQQAKDRESEKFLKVRQESDLAGKLLLALGESRLMSELPPGLALADATIDGVTTDGRRAAQLLMAAHGDDVLRVLASALADAGFDVPHWWTGGATAQRFVNHYGFPASWAGDPESPSSPAPYETVPGPRRPIALHEYQVELVNRMYAHLTQDEERRAMLQIPTGSGKTRIAVEAAVRAIRNGVLKGPVLWIAQSQELAEQAIETWAYVWQTEGDDRPLRITRMWGGIPSAVPVPDGPQVVVAIDDTAVKRLPQENYAWLRECSLVLIDEAHFAVPATYTSILSYLGIDQHRTSRHLIGLTATAFRGENEKETRTLASRFGHKRLDHGAFAGDDAYGHLQSLKVLAKVEHEELLGGSYVLSSQQVLEMQRNHAMALPPAALHDLAKDVGRTRRIVDRIEQLPEDWPVLVFATSVEHAQVLAGLLQVRGVTAASIDGQTPPNSRRRRIAAFKQERIRVLTNFKVLTQGFDAPAVRAVVVARPTFSPNTYIQMVGRGLRGELNGGKDSCLILDVADNIENFGRELAYTRMEHLWHRG
ncbi:sacsin N-terminal ATP-binding-like domain-containing protein [Streptacidiphilus albus]|uniref:sacsin N-terminal ATP-binding-like domain-containing protein n=1 Tax=Streptacidiphilus albus TaxID=105425 RepID=UPI0005A914B6|nr:helicase-related protein [Streptacidiphilus albus]